ncbi:MAG: hypothetical protein EBR09_01745 [Proteobacteria bacterium]|nr:hypothetical protein [Pseudomonadota bacterium]
MSQPALNNFIGGAGRRILRRGLLSLPFLLPVGMPAFPQGKTPATAAGIRTQCQPVPLNTGVREKAEGRRAQLASMLADFENSFLLADAERFASLLSPALMKSPEDAKKIFQGTLLEYDLRRVKLQRNWIWELDAGENPSAGQLIDCRDMLIQPVFGPRHQFAVQYSAFTGQNQTRLMVIFAFTATKSETDKPNPNQTLGLVQLQAQRWTYDGRSPDRLLSEARQSASAGQTLAGSILAEASARVFEINAYVISPQLSEARSLASQLAAESEGAQAKFLAAANDAPEWKAEKIVPVFRDGSLAVGVKIRMNREIALNDQVKLCRLSGTKLFQQPSAWRERFSGFECMPYSQSEDYAKPPSGGSQYYPWSALNK